jgi:cytidylate kinase
MKRTSESHDASHLVERQMLLSQVRDRAGSLPAESAPAHGHRFITIARAVGSLGDEVAAELAARLHWHVFDREIVDTIAQNSRVRQDLVRDLDERSQSLIHDTVARLLLMAAGISFGNEEYHQSLLKSLALLAARGKAIIVGRGSAYALQGEPGLHLRFVASPEIRMRRLVEQWRVAPEAARRRMEQIDAERHNFVHNHFRQSLDDLRFYDAVFNTDRQTVEQVADAVMGMVKPQEGASRPEETAGLGIAPARTPAVHGIPSQPAAR